MGSHAAAKAGFSQKHAKTTAHRLLKSPVVQKRISDIQAEETRNADVTVADVLRELMAIANDVSARNMDRLKAAELLGKHLGMFTDRVETTTKSKGSAVAVQVVQFTRQD